MRPMTVAIDGPAGAGKSTVAKVIAERLQYTYIDTGAMYRAITWAVRQRKLDIQNEGAMQSLLDMLHIRLVAEPEQSRIFVNDKDVTKEIRTFDVTSHVSAVAALAVVREKLVQLQRELSAEGNVILDGRDIGTVVLPDADVKVFLTATVASRAKRRFLENQAKGGTETLEDIARSIAARDTMDSQRPISPLKKADDAVLVDNSDLTIDETAEVIIGLIRRKA